jgi:carboxypeptidase C (cathepsin A)
MSVAGSDNIGDIKTIDDIYNLFKYHSQNDDVQYILSLKENTNIVKCLKDRSKIRARYYPECALYFHKRINALQCIDYIISNNVMNYTNIMSMYTSRNKYNRYMVFEYYFHIMVEQFRKELNSYEYEGFQWMKQFRMPRDYNTSSDSKFVSSLLQMIHVINILDKKNVRKSALAVVLIIFINRVLANISIAICSSDFRMTFLYFLQKIENSRVYSENECIRNKIDECKNILAYICVHDMYEW